MTLTMGDSKPIQNGHSVLPRRLLSAAEIPPLMRIPFILNGYRILHQPWSFYFKSFFTLHNESMNVWTHFFGGVIIIIEASRFVHDYGAKWPMETEAIKFYTASSIIMHFASSITHLLHSRSCAVHLITFMCDYCAISVSAMGISMTVFCFCALPDYAKALAPFVLPLSTLNAAAITAVFCYLFITRRRQYSSLIRVIMFLPTVSFYLWTFTTFVYQLYQRLIDPNSIVQTCHIGHMLVLGFSFIFYASRLPERCSPGRFDVFFNSHQLFHGLVSVSQCLIIWAVRHDLNSDSQLLVSRRSEPIPISRIWLCFFILIFSNLFLSTLYFHRYKREEDFTEGMEFKKR